MKYVNEVDPDGTVRDGIGVNCCKVKYVYDLSEKISRHILESNCPTRIVVLYPNSGEEWDDEKKEWVEGTGCTNSKDFANEIMKCIRNINEMCDIMNKDPLGIFVGGCCRTTPETIGAIRKAVDEYLLKF
jgi:homocysteine S-methyltransferase